MSIESARREVAALNEAYQRDLDAIGREYAAAWKRFDDRIVQRQQQHRAACEAIAKREGAGSTQIIGAYLSRPGLDQLRLRLK